MGSINRNTHEATIESENNEYKIHIKPSMQELHQSTKTSKQEEMADSQCENQHSDHVLSIYTISIIISSNPTRIAKQFGGMSLISISIIGNFRNIDFF
jgi:hypothetical protein